jgi:hypothetical protein
MTIAVRGIIKLFSLIKHENKLYQEILAFFISHDNNSVRIYSYYFLIDGYKTTFYRYLIKKFDFTNKQNENKWTSYKFTKNIYDI